MKKILFIALIAFTISAKAQITLLYTCDSSSTSLDPQSQLMMINFAVSGERYVNINGEGKYISIYDMNYSLVKKINCSGFPLILQILIWVRYYIYLKIYLALMVK